MQIIETGIPGLLRLEPRVFRDERGFFLETYRRDLFAALGVPAGFVQDNHARSEQPGVLRGLHFQLPPATQAKLVWVTRGSVFDVAVDLRAGSPTYGKWYGCELSERNFARLFVPRGFAHGYMTLEPGTEFQYKVDAYYSPERDAGIAWDDPDLGITWPDIAPALPILSDKDRRLPRLRDFQSPFTFEPAPPAKADA